jgi:hypothetical protein
LLNVWNKYLCCAGNIQERSIQDYRKSWKKGCRGHQARRDMYLCHTERRWKVSERRGEGFEEEGDEILKAGGEKREGGESSGVDEAGLASSVSSEAVQTATPC